MNSKVVIDTKSKLFIHGFIINS